VWLQIYCQELLDVSIDEGVEVAKLHSLENTNLIAVNDLQCYMEVMQLLI
jgi:hypothetical protein